MVKMENSSLRYAVGIDIGGTTTKLGLVNSAGAVVNFHRIPTDSQGVCLSEFLDRIVEITRDLYRNSPGQVIGVGLSTLGPLNTERTGPFLSANAPILTQVNFRDLVVSALHCPVVVNNDLTAHALGEYYFGSGWGVRRFMSLALGTGVGTGVIIDGQPLRLWGGTAGDSGRMILDPNSEVRCGCGVAGSAEALCGTANIERLARERYGYFVSAHDVISKVRDGSDDIAVGIVREIGRYVGQLIASLYAIFFPDKVVLTGGTATAGFELLQACRTRFDELSGVFMQQVHHAASDQFEILKIEIGEMKESTGVVGSVVELFQEDRRFS